MSFHENVKDMLNRYGSDVTIIKNDTEYKTKGFIQPLRHQTRVYADMEIQMGGYKDSRYYLYIGSPDVKFFRSDNTIISTDDKQYVVHTSECYMLTNKALYVWAVLKPYKMQRQDDYDSD